MNSEYYNRIHEQADIVAGVERGKLVQHDAHVTAWRWQRWRAMGF